MSFKYANKDILQQIDNVLIEFENSVEGNTAGKHKSMLIGRSLEFVQHREYVCGDDLRTIDWKVYARKDKFFVKQYHQETNLFCQILLDCSKSMQFKAEGLYSKYEYASFLATCLSYILLNQGDAVGIVKFDDKIISQVQCRSGKDNFMTIAEFLDDEVIGGKTDLLNVLSNLLPNFKNNSLIFLISDLSISDDKFIDYLKNISVKGYFVVVLHIVDKREVDLNYKFLDVSFEDMEDPNFTIKTNIEEIKDNYIREFEKIVNKYNSQLNCRNLRYVFIETSKSIIENLKEVVSLFIRS